MRRSLATDRELGLPTPAECTRTALATAPFLFGTIPAAARSARGHVVISARTAGVIGSGTRSADIKLNDGLLLLRIRTALSSGRRAALAENTHHSPRGHDFNCSTGAAGFPQNRRPHQLLQDSHCGNPRSIFSKCCLGVGHACTPKTRIRSISV
jgi:hypothetical protein